MPTRQRTESETPAPAPATIFRRDRLVLAGFTLAAFFLAAIAATALSYLKESHEAQKMVRHTFEVKAELNGLLSELKDAETGQRGYLLTNDERYLAPYHRALHAVARRQDAVRRLTVDNPGQQKRLAALEALTREKLAELDETIRVQRQRGTKDAVAIVRTDRGKRLLDEIRSIVGEAEAEEDRLLAQRAAAGEASRRTETAMLLAGNGASLALFIGVFLLLKMEISRRSVVERELREHRDLLETRVEERTRSLAALNERLAGEVEDRKKSEQAQRESRRLFQSVVDGTSDIVYVKDSAGRFLMANAAAKRFLGLDVTLPGAGDGILLFRSSEANRLTETDLEVIASGETRTFEETLACSDGLIRSYLSTKGPLPARDGKEPGMFAISRDISEMKRTEAERMQLKEQLRQSQKMDAVGQLAGGIAHYFNNMLQVIVGHASFLKERLDGAPGGEQAGEIVETAVRASTLAQGLLTFSHKQPLNLKRSDVNALIGAFRRFLDRLIGDNVELALRLSPGKLLAVMDEIQIQHVLVNLVTNARDAMQSRGMLFITTAPAEPDPDGSPGKFVRITVSDTGAGMSDDVREKIFEPFFTTKEIGKGTGLGLAVVYGIVTQHGGTISCESAPGRGTTFTILLPAAPDDQQAEADLPAASGDPPRGSETILVAEDDARVLEVIRLSLEGGGYTVLAAADGREALSVYADHRDRIDLIILDYSMPGMTGKEALDRIRRIDPGVRGFFLSGFAGESVDLAPERGIAFDLIQKPISPRALLERVRSALDS
jgi:PAS domain S-box-containing protein